MMYHMTNYYSLYSTFKSNSGINGVFTTTYFPITFNGTTKFIDNTGTDLKVISTLKVCCDFVCMLDRCIYVKSMIANSIVIL